MIYGYINEFGQLTSNDFSADEIRNLSSTWKPVAGIDNDKLKSEDASYIIRLQPFDAGDHIDFHYVKKFDRQKLRQANKQMEEELSLTDYRVIKCYEASLLGKEMPYDIESLVASRQALRDRINQNEIVLANA